MAERAVDRSRGSGGVVTGWEEVERAAELAIHAMKMQRKYQELLPQEVTDE